MAKIYIESELPDNTIDLLKNGKITYRGCGMGKNCGCFKIKISGKEYMIEGDLFDKFWNINKMRFDAPYRRRH